MGLGSGLRFNTGPAFVDPAFVIEQFLLDYSSSSECSCRYEVVENTYKEFLENFLESSLSLVKFHDTMKKQGLKTASYCICILIDQKDKTIV